MKGFLNPSERQELRIQHKTERDRRTCDRIKAVLLYDKGWTLEQIAEALLMSHEAIRQHILDYECSRKLSPESGGSEEKMNKFQVQFLVDHLKSVVYTKCKEIIHFVWEEFGIAYSVAGMTAWLKKHGFSYKKPAVIPGKSDKELQEQWIKDYKELQSTCNEDDAICFMDGVHPTHNTKPAYGWIPTGENKEIPTNSGRQRLNLSGSINIDTKEVIIHEDETLDADSTIRFLQKIELAYPTKENIHIFCDNARYYRNKKVSEFLQTSRIQLHFLPPYSPNLNPIERLWKLMNEEVINNQYYKDFKDFKKEIFNFFESLADPPIRLWEMLKTRITDNFRAIGFC